MTYRYTRILETPGDRAWAKQAIDKAPDGMQVKITKPTRTDKQNALCHALLSDIAEQLWWPPDSLDPEQLDLEVWKRRTTLQWLIDSNTRPEVIVALEDEEFALLLPHTSDLRTNEMASYCDWLYAFGAKCGVAFKEKPPDNGPEPPPRESDR